ncbi:MBL fold metallo-hydrolase [Pseudoroseicyclus tamaricis]|uniref:MBL fold metallo-hydrolase n=1 Tax=Pseudoroseicyclus tamaricis TaxID=2705421 RepID=A0A6B2JTF0_9RHOB|nr:MBL fold metallo-hydrolase [Pseudoroseicyclus tamaricis]NDU99453.1 MBL fold metallo-hydrolase [Pseudoroseicyclus tamaricis]
MTELSHPFDTAPAPGEMWQVAEGLHWARLPLPMKLDHVNIYITDEGDSWTIIDTGLNWAKGRSALQALLDGPLSGKPVARVIVTHHHPDHVGLAGWLMARGAELWMPRTGWLLSRMLILDEEDAAPPEAFAFWRRAGMDPAELASREGSRPFNFADVVAPLPAGYRRLQEGEVIRLAGRDWRVRMGDGHAPEQATFWAEDEALVIGSDQLLPRISPNISVHQFEPEADPLAEWFESCARLSAFATPEQLVLPGHRLPYRGLPFRLRQLADNHTGALARLHAFLAEPRVGHECFPVLFSREISADQYTLALGETLAHLNHLWLRGDALREEVDGAWHWRRA